MKVPVYWFVSSTNGEFDLTKVSIEKLQLHRAFESLIYDYTNLTLPDITNLFKVRPPAVIYTVGANQFSMLSQLPYEYRKKWLHSNTIGEIMPHYLNNCFMMGLSRTSPDQPLLSVITTTFHSGERIMRPYNSLLGQSYTNWEWIIWDDSVSSKDSDATWNKLKELEKSDIRIRIYRASGNSGYIGAMKQLACKLARGQWIIELDHDDDIVPNLFDWIVNVTKDYPDAGFIYTDYLECHEDDYEPFNYGDHFSFGFGSYFKQVYNGKWQNICQSSPVNPKTLRHIVGVPNHVRCWRTDIYEELGGHRAELPVADDYELILRTFTSDINVQWIRIAELGYIQYRNRGGNNFTFLRNQLIQDLTNLIASNYDTPIHNLLIDDGVDDNVKWAENTKDWLIPKIHTYKPLEQSKTWRPLNMNKTVSIVLTTHNNPSNLVKAVLAVLSQSFKDWELYIVGYGCLTLDNTMNIFLRLNDKRIKWWNLTVDDDGLTDLTRRNICRNYAVKMLVQSDWITYLDDEHAYENNDILGELFGLISPSGTDNIYSSSATPTEYNSIHNKTLLKQVGLWTPTLDISQHVATVK